MAEASSIYLENFKYDLDESCIARYPLPDRSASRLLLYRRGTISQDRFINLPDHLPDGAWLVFNNTRVIQARLKFRKASGAQIEIFCLEPVEPSDYELAFRARSLTTWHCLVGNLKKWKAGPVTLKTSVNGTEVVVAAILKEKLDDGVAIVFQWNVKGITFGEIMEHSGSTPIPPYLKRDAEESDRERYQTIYGVNNGSVAAPTAGLHFTGEMMDRLEQRRVRMSEITLHVGAGTFVPVKEENARNHSMHSEQVIVTRNFLEQWLVQTEGPIAVGTTSTRSLESLYWLGVKIKEQPLSDPSSLSVKQWENEKLPQGIPLPESLEWLIRFCDLHRLDQLHFSTQLMIVPGYRFMTIRGLVTNFHMPGSTLLLLIAAFIGDDWKKVYSYALEEKFRFLSYGDSSLLLPLSDK
jgi:S-adenosylmethionine:tRNA ribosyltransferase-isomerase